MVTLPSSYVNERCFFRASCFGNSRTPACKATSINVGWSPLSNILCIDCRLCCWRINMLGRLQNALVSGDIHLWKQPISHTPYDCVLSRRAQTGCTVSPKHSSLLTKNRQDIVSCSTCRRGRTPPLPPPTHSPPPSYKTTAAAWDTPQSTSIIWRPSEAQGLTLSNQIWDQK